MSKWITFDTGSRSYHLNNDRASRFVLTGGSPGRIMRVAQYLENPVGNYYKERGLCTVHGYFLGVPITAFSSGMGPASVSIVLPEIIESYFRIRDAKEGEDDVRKEQMYIIRIGTSGAMQPHLQIGDMVITQKAHRMETTSDLLLKDYYDFGTFEAWADPVVIDSIEKATQGYKLETQKCYKGDTLVVNEIYVHANGVKEPDPDGILAVSMEFSAIRATAELYTRMNGCEIKCGNLLMISDNPLLDHSQVDMTEFNEKKDDFESSHIGSALGALHRLSELEEQDKD